MSRLGERPVSIYRPRVERVYDYATDQPVCRRCWADISDRLPTARYCSEACRQRDKARRQWQELRQRKQAVR